MTRITLTVVFALAILYFSGSAKLIVKSVQIVHDSPNVFEQARKGIK